MRRFASLRRRGDFARLRARGRRTPTANFAVFQADAGARDVQALVGITISKSVGGAVVRNRLRRRIGAVVQEVFVAGKPRARVLIVARPAAAALDFAGIRTELLGALS